MPIPKPASLEREAPDAEDQTLSWRELVRRRKASAQGAIRQNPRQHGCTLFPMSLEQEQIWLAWYADPSSTLYHGACFLRLRGPFDPEAFDRSLHALIDRHEILHTTFSTTEDGTFQKVWESLPWNLARYESVHCDGCELEECFPDAFQELHRPMDLERESCFRASLLRMNHEDHALLFKMDHIGCDGWSANLLVQELFSIYRRFASGQGPELPALAYHYADYAVWQREFMQTEGWHRQEDYWKQQLAGANAEWQLPLDRIRPARPSFRGATEFVLVPAGTVEGLQQVCLQCRMTLFMAVLAAFKVLLHKYSSQEDIVVGTSVSNRNHMGMEQVLGTFVNFLPIRTEIASHMTFRDVLQNVRGSCLGAFIHRNVPLARMVAELQLPRRSDRHPFFQVAMIWQLDAPSWLRVDELKIEPLKSGALQSKLDATIFVSNEQGGVGFSCIYNTDLFDASTIRFMLNNLAGLLPVIPLDLDKPVGEVTIAPLLQAHS